MRKIIIVLIALLLPVSAQGQVFDLVRSLQTSDVNSFPFARLNDTAGENNFSHTGTLTIESGVSISNVTIISLACTGDICVEENKSRELIGLSDGGKTVTLKDDDEPLGEIRFSIISLTPTLILMKTNNNGTVELTEWAERH